jgi:phosphate transport system substrate-binding protein
VLRTKKFFALLVASIFTMGLLAGCANDGEAEGNGFDADNEIIVVSREDGSGTRGAFVELMGIEEKNDDGSRVDNTTKEAIIANKTDVAMTNVSGDTYAIGYISLGSMNDTVKAVDIDRVKASADTVKDGSYPIARPFNIATKGEPTGLAKDFIDFIMSSEGQAVVSDSYIGVNDAAEAYSGTKPAGKITVAGSSSVTPVMEKLAEAYEAMNPDAEIEIQMSDSTAGMTAAIDGTADIGMASRELKAEEAAQLDAAVIALDGIAVIVNPKNAVTNLTSQQVKDIFTGKVTMWSDIVK